MKNHFTIPIFVPELACPHQCVFCNQRKISGTLKVPSIDEAEEIIKQHLKTIPKENSEIEIGFFGGNFTGIDLDLQIKYLSLALHYSLITNLSGIRISTRPDYIDEEKLALLKEYGVYTIELGAQSMVDEVLIASGRGHTVSDTEKASKMILDHGFSLGLQMMIGLPKDSFERSLYTAERIVELGADNTRIYPTLVIQDTVLAEMYHEVQYQPLSLTTATLWSKELFKIFEKAEVKVIRMGLHPSEGLLSGEELLAGPFHKSFRELVMTELWNEKFEKTIKGSEGERVVIYVNPKQFNFAIGYNGKNKKMLLQKFETVTFKSDPSLKGRKFHVDYS
jgi:histone acetyltransferase (RNA polymerase elongator complex component)